MMAISVFDAARHLCKRSGWSLTNLQLQKLIYLAQMIHLGEHGEALINEHFEAWDYGPVQPDLYHDIKVYGAAPVVRLFHPAFAIEEGTESEALDSVHDQLSHRPSGWLISLTHWEDGAWAKHYKRGRRGVEIPNDDIRAEYEARARD